MSDLELASTQDLVTELQRRHSATLVVLEAKVKTTDQDDTILAYSGGLNTALGMAERARSTFTDKAERQLRDLSDDAEGPE